MKVLSKEEEQAHYRATLWGGTVGGFSGLGLGLASVVLAQRRYPAFRNLTLPLKAFLVTSAGTFGGIIAADHASRSFESSQHVQDQYYERRRREEHEASRQGMSFAERAFEWGRKERYKLVGASWVASMVGAFTLVGRNPYLTGQQKLVQARVYAQGITLAILVAVASLEISERRKEEQAEKSGHPIQHHEEDEEHTQQDMWKDMVAAEEERLAKRDKAIKEQEERDRKQHKNHRKQSKKADPKGNKDKDKDEDEEGPKPIEGKKGEGKRMKKVSDRPDDSAVP